MLVLLFSSFTSTLIAFFGHKRRSEVSLKISWFILFLFLAFRYNYGNDYLGYLYFYLNADYSDQFIPRDYDFKGIEIGWSFTSWIFHTFFGAPGFIIMVAFFSGLNCLVFYRLIKRYVPQSYFWFALLYYCINFEMLLIMSSAMRQSVALSFFLLSFDFLRSREFLKYSFFIFLAALFHTSALFLIFLYFIPIIKKVNIYSLFLAMSSFIIVIFFKEELGNILFSFTGKSLEFYSIYESGEYEERSFGLGAIVNVIIYSILYLRSFRSNNLMVSNIIAKIILLLIFIYPLGIINPMISRLNYYLVPITLIGFSNVLMEWDNKIFKNLFILLTLSFTMYTFYLFHTNSVYANFFSNYRTVFQFVSDIDLKDIYQ